MKTGCLLLLLPWFAAVAHAEDGRYPGILDSFERFKGESGDSVQGYRGDDRHSTWTVNGNAIVIKDDGTAYDGRNYLRILDLTGEQHHATKRLDADYLPEVRLYNGGVRPVTFSFAYRFQMTEQTAATPSLNMKAHFRETYPSVDPETGEATETVAGANTDAFNIFGAPADVVPAVRARTNVWLRVDGDLRYCLINSGTRPRLLLHALTITDTRRDPSTGEETVLWTSQSETGYWRDSGKVGYAQMTMADGMRFFLEYLNFFTGGAGYYVADLDAIRIGEWHAPTTLMILR